MENKTPIRRRQGRGSRETVANGSHQTTDVNDVVEVDAVSSEAVTSDTVDEVVVAETQPRTSVGTSRRYSDQENLTVIHTAPVYNDVVTLLRVIIVNSWIIILLTALGGAAGYLYAKSEPDTYVSDGKMMVVLPDMITDENLRDQLEIFDQMNTSVLGNYVQLLSTRRVQDSAGASLAEKYDAGVIENAEVEITPVQNSTFINIEVASTSPEFSQDMVTALFDGLVVAAPPAMLRVFPVQLQDVPELPTNSSGPNTRLSLVFGAGGGAALGVALAFLFDYYRQYQRSRKKALKAAKAPA